MRGDEKRVVEAFGRYLADDGWAVEYEVEYCDIRANKPNGDLLFGEAKGRTAAIGLDVDTLYGQLLRRMPADRVGEARFAVVVPQEALQAALRVPQRVRMLLGIEVYSVDDTDRVTKHRLTAPEGS